MPRQISGTLRTHLDGGSFTVADLLYIRLGGRTGGYGYEFRFTNAPRAITWGGNLYAPIVFAMPRVRGSLSLEVDSLDLELGNPTWTLTGAGDHKLSVLAMRGMLDGAFVSLAKLFMHTGSGLPLNADPNMADSSAWSQVAAQPVFATIADGQTGTSVARSAGAGTYSGGVETQRIPVSVGKTYAFDSWMRTISGSGDTAFGGVAFFDANGWNIQNPGGGTYYYYVASGVTPPASWTQYAGDFGAGTARPIPANAYSMAPLFLLSYGAGTAVHEVQGLTISEKTGGIEAVTLFTGTIENAEPSATQTRLVVKSALAKLAEERPFREIQPACPYAVYDARCGVTKAAPFVSSHTVMASPAPTRDVIKLDPLTTVTKPGWVEFTGGSNKGVTRAIRSNSSGTLTLAVALPFVPAVGDGANVVIGCDQSRVTCRATFSNLDRFGGYADAPRRV